MGKMTLWGKVFLGIRTFAENDVCGIWRLGKRAFGEKNVLGKSLKGGAKRVLRKGLRKEPRERPGKGVEEGYAHHGAA